MTKRKSRLNQAQYCTIDQAWMYTGICPQTWRKWLKNKKVPGKKDYRGRWRIDMLGMFNQKVGKWHELGLKILDNLTIVEEFEVDNTIMRVTLRAK
jgi:hypothetical protein